MFRVGVTTILLAVFLLVAFVMFFPIRGLPAILYIGWCLMMLWPLIRRKDEKTS